MYEEFFGFVEVPFNITPDPKFVYFSKKHQQAFSNLLYGIEHRKGFIEVTGDIGSGKTTLCRVLLSHLGSSVESALIVNPNLSEVQLLATIVEDFNIKVPRRSKKAYFDALNKFLMEVNKRGSTTVLILDEAQNLSARALEQIRLLSNFETNREKLLQTVLVGQPELRDILKRPSLTQLRQRINIWCHLSALDEEETKAYVQHRLTVAGAGKRKIFSQPALDYVYRYSKGTPRVINVLCDRALLMAYLHEERQVTPDLVEAAHNEMQGYNIR